MTKRLVAIVLIVAVTLMTVPLTAFAAPEPTVLPAMTIDEQYIEVGAFYFASAGAEIEENAGHGYLLKICRFGDAKTAQSVRLVMTDVTASYGKDYTVELYGESGSSVENAKESQSMLEYLETNETEEYNYADAIIDGSIGASDQLTEEEQSELELNDSEKQAVEAMSQEVLASLSGNEETSATSEEPTGSGSALAAARENAVGLADDRAPMSYTLPEDSGLQNDSTGYMQDGISEVSEVLNAAYLTLDFAADETEKTVMITPKDNDKSDGTLQSGFALEGVGDAIVSGMYGNFTLKILDDEPYVPDTIEFGAATYAPEDGYVTVTVKRSGSLTSVLTASLDSADDTAIGGLDYSEVHAKLVFGFGLEERTVRIPVRSTNLTGPVSFKLVLHDPQECVIGKNGTAVCTISPEDESFEGKDEAALEKLEKNVLGVSQDIDLDSEIIGDPFCLPKMEKCNFLYDTSSKAEAYGDNGWFITAFMPHGKGGTRNSSVWFYPDSDLRGHKHYDYCGYDVNWEINPAPPQMIKANIRNITGDSLAEEWWNGGTYSDTISKSEKLYLEQGLSEGIEFGMTASGIMLIGPTESKFTIKSVKPIMRLFKVDMIGADPFMLIDSDGNKVKNTQTTAYANENQVMMLNTDSNNSLITTCGNAVTVELRNNTSPICYISALQIVNTETKEAAVVKTFPEGTTSASLYITNEMIGKYVDYVNFKKNENGQGLYGHLAIKPVLSNMPATVRVKKDERASVTVWDGKIIPVVSEDESETVYQCNVGDCLRLNTEVLGKYKNQQYECPRVLIEPIRPAGKQKYDIYVKPGQTYAQEVACVSEMRISPLPERGGNAVVVRVKKSDLALFDTTSGIFNSLPEENEEYYEYVVDAGNVTGKTFAMSAKTADAGNVPVWWEEGNSRAKYTQGTFYFTALAEAESNFVYLTAAQADKGAYTLSGTVYYDDAALGGTASAQAWYPACGAFYIIDDAHYGIADINGAVKTKAFPGITGNFVRVKISTAGYDEYMDVKLTGEGKKNTDIAVADHVIAEADMRRPHIISVVAKNPLNSEYGKVKINDNVTTFTITVDTDDPLTGEAYTYSYTDENGVLQTREETPIGVELVIIDPVTHTEKFVLPEAIGSGTTWSKGYTFTFDEATKYKAGDLVYARLITDRFVGDGCTEDEDGNRTPVEIFRQTTYPPVRTGLVLSGVNPKEPVVMDLELKAPNHSGKEESYHLPIIGDLTMMINALGISFGVASTETGGVRLFFGKQIKSGTTGNCFDGNGNPVSDTGFKVTLSNFDEGLNDLTDMISGLGSKNELGAMSLGIPVWKIEPMAGIWLEFSMYHDASQEEVEERLEFTGGGGYIGVIGFFRYTYYMLVYGIPVYVGGDVTLTLMAELGIAVDSDTHIPFVDIDQEAFDKLLNNSHFQFIFRAMVVGNAYAGVGICGTIGIRGGFTLTMRFIANPMVSKNYPTVRPTGVAISGAIKFWADLVLFSLPIPLYSWDFLKQGYFEDVEELIENETSKADMNTMLSAMESLPIESKPRGEKESRFVGDRNTIGSSFKSVFTRVIVTNSYDDAQQKLIPLDDGKVLMVYLDDDKEREANERTVLKYMLYNGECWETPVVIQDDGTADFAPSVCDTGKDILISWVSRPEKVTSGDYAAYLSSNEIYTVRMDKETMALGEIERLTDDAYYDTAPMAVYDKDSGDALLIYQKSEVNAIENAADLMNEGMPYTNGSVLMYMLYDGATGEWVRDRFFENELADGADAEALLEEFKGQRFVPNAAFGKTNPVVADFTVNSGIVTNLNAADIEAFTEKYFTEHDITPEECTEDEAQAFNEALEAFKQEYTKHYGIYAYTVDEDNNLATENDRELFVQLYDFDTHTTEPAIRVTDNNENDSVPRLVCCADTSYLFWLHNGKEIRYISAESMMTDVDENGMVNANIVDVKTEKDNELSINNFTAFADKSQNLFVTWAQNSAELQQDDTAFNPTQDIYLAGYVKTTDENAPYSAWSAPIRMTNNNALNELPEYADIGDGRLMMVNTQYNVDMSGDIYEESGVALVETDYVTVSSLEIKEAAPITVPWEAGEEFDVSFRLANVGVKCEPSFSYTASLVLDGKVVQQLEERKVDGAVPAGSGIWLTDRFTLPEEAVGRLEDLELRLVMTEENSEESSISTAKMFDGKPQYVLTPESGTQDGDEFILTGFVKNVGAPATGKQTIEIIGNNGLPTVLATVELPAMDKNVDVPFEVRVKIDPDSVTYGYAEYVLTVRDEDGTALSEPEIATAALTSPFGITLSGVEDEVITLQKGESFVLSATYEPSTFYRNAAVAFAVDDAAVATVENNALVGLAAGETTLRLSVAPYGGKKTVTVVVLEDGLLGDANDDGAVNMKDVLVLRKQLAGMSTEIDMKNADCNEDGEVNMKDVLVLRKFLAGMIEKLGA